MTAKWLKIFCIIVETVFEYYSHIHMYTSVGQCFLQYIHPSWKKNVILWSCAHEFGNTCNVEGGVVAHCSCKVEVSIHYTYIGAFAIKEGQEQQIVSNEYNMW